MHYSILLVLVMLNIIYGCGECWHDLTLLTERAAFEYRWKLCVNNNGGIYANIPDDNHVEHDVNCLKNWYACMVQMCLMT